MSGQSGVRYCLASLEENEALHQNLRKGKALVFWRLVTIQWEAAVNGDTTCSEDLFSRVIWKCEQGKQLSDKLPVTSTSSVRKTGDFAGVISLLSLLEPEFCVSVAQTKLTHFDRIVLIVITFSFSQRRSKVSRTKDGRFHAWVDGY